MTKDFKKIQKEWYSKLKESGFDDIEVEEKGKIRLKKWDSVYFFCRHTSDEFFMKKKYYEMVTDFLNSYPFDREQDRTVWKFHSEGLTVRAIAEETQMKSCQVFLILSSLKKKMNGQE